MTLVHELLVKAETSSRKEGREDAWSQILFYCVLS